MLQVRRASLRHETVRNTAAVKFRGNVRNPDQVYVQTSLIRLNEEQQIMCDSKWIWSRSRVFEFQKIPGIS